jgi:two-component system, NtrC family, response regulator AtoC
LRVLQERTFERVGGNTMIPFEARVIAATNRDLAAMVSQGQFREDLFFRLNVMSIVIPPLRERREDIPVLVYYLLEKINRVLHRPITKVSDDVMKKLGTAAWPGNVRELENVLTQAVLRSTGEVLTLDFTWIAPPGSATPPALRTLADVEKEHIVMVLHAVQGNLGKACETLGITRPTLRKKIEDYGIVF